MAFFCFSLLSLSPFSIFSSSSLPVFFLISISVSFCSMHSWSSPFLSFCPLVVVLVVFLVLLSDFWLPWTMDPFFFQDFPFSRWDLPLFVFVLLGFLQFFFFFVFVLLSSWQDRNERKSETRIECRETRLLLFFFCRLILFLFSFFRFEFLRASNWFLGSPFSFELTHFVCAIFFFLVLCLSFLNSGLFREILTDPFFSDITLPSAVRVAPGPGQQQRPLLLDQPSAAGGGQGQLTQLEGGVRPGRGLGRVPRFPPVGIHSFQLIPYLPLHVHARCLSVSFAHQVDVIEKDEGYTLVWQSLPLNWKRIVDFLHFL